MAASGVVVVGFLARSFAFWLGRRPGAPAVVLAFLLAAAPHAHGAATGLAAVSADGPAPIAVPLLALSTATGSQGRVRVVNRSGRAGTVSILAYDDTGLRHGPATLSLGAGETVHLDARDIEDGNAEKGLRGGVGAGTGAWRLELASALDIEVLSYARTQDGLVGSMQGVVPRTGSGHRVALFNPASVAGQASRLRLVNPGAQAAAVTIEGIDDRGLSPGGAVRLSLPARASRTLTAVELESGEGEGLSGALGDGSGLWRLVVSADRRVEVMNLLVHSGTGAVSNLSQGPVAVRDGDDGATAIHDVALFPSASNADVEGVLRIVNRTRHAGQVSI